MYLIRILYVIRMTPITKRIKTKLMKCTESTSFFAEEDLANIKVDLTKRTKLSTFMSLFENNREIF